MTFRSIIFQVPHGLQSYQSELHRNQLAIWDLLPLLIEGFTFLVDSEFMVRFVGIGSILKTSANPFLVSQVILHLVLKQFILITYNIIHRNCTVLIWPMQLGLCWKQISFILAQAWASLQRQAGISTFSEDGARYHIPRGVLSDSFIRCIEVSHGHHEAWPINQLSRFPVCNIWTPGDQPQNKSRVEKFESNWNCALTSIWNGVYIWAGRDALLIWRKRCVRLSAILHIHSKHEFLLLLDLASCTCL